MYTYIFIYYDKQPLLLYNAVFGTVMIYKDNRRKNMEVHII